MDNYRPEGDLSDVTPKRQHIPVVVPCTKESELHPGVRVRWARVPTDPSEGMQSNRRKSNASKFLPEIVILSQKAGCDIQVVLASKC